LAHRIGERSEHEATLLVRVGLDIVGLLIFLLVLSLFSWNWLSHTGPTTQNAIGLASAFATAAAVIFSLWFAFRTDRKLAREALQKANMMAAKVEVELRLPSQYYEATLASLSFGTFKEQQHRLNHVLNLLAKPMTGPATEDVTWLIPLPNDCAGRIVRAFSVFVHLRSFALEHATAAGNGTMTEADVTRHLKYIECQLANSLELLQAAHRECIAAANLGAPPLPAQELGHDVEQ
jgi:hypothetical protein